MNDPTSPTSPTSPGTREKLLAATERLVYAGGINATGMDRIVRVSGVARKSIYRYFRTKEELVAQALRERDRRWMGWLIGETEKAPTVEEKLPALFVALGTWFASEGFRGCAFINAAGEMDQGPIREVAQEHKARLRQYLRELAVEGGADDPETMAAELLILIDGAITVALVTGDKGAADRAACIAHRLYQDSFHSPTGESHVV